MSANADTVRPGRLLGVREFRRLTRSGVQQLAAANGLEPPEKAAFTGGSSGSGAPRRSCSPQGPIRRR
jgi:hypothetical protein